MAGVAEDGQSRHAAVQLDGDLPHGSVAIELLLIARESAVYCGKAGDAGLVDALQRSYPQFEVGVDRILHQHRDVDTFQRIGQQLHRKRVGAGAGSYPQHVDVVFQRQLHMSRSGYLRSYEHRCLFLHLLEPGQRFLAVALKASGLGTRLPYSCSEHVAALTRELLGGGDDLLLSLCGARPGDHERTYVVARQV